MLCHRCGTELAGAAVCGNCGAPASGARKRFRPTLTAVKAPDPSVLRAAATGLERGVVVGEQFTLGDPIGEAPGGWNFDGREAGGTRVVLRFIGPVDDPDARAAALEVLERARRLSHDGITRTYAVGSHGGWLFVAHERLEGLTLAAIIGLRREKKQHFTLDELLPIFEQIRDALLHAHRHLPHGGLDPASIHILPASLKVDGFGLASALPGDQFARGRAAAGRDRTLAPEVRRGERPTVASDVYGLGAIIYEMITGQPFDDDAVPPSVALGVAGGHGLDRLVARATAADPERRFADVVALAEALSDVVDGPPLALDDGERTRRVVAPGSPVDETTQRLPAHRDDAPAKAEGADGPGGRLDSPDSSRAAEPSEASRPPPPPDAAASASSPVLLAKQPRAPASAAVERAPAAEPGPPSGPPPMPDAPRVQPRPSFAGLGPDGPPATPPGAPGHAAGPGGRGAVIGARPSVGGRPSVLIDPAFARLDTAPPPADYQPGADRTPTQAVRVPPSRSPWLVRSNAGFALLLALIIGAVAAGVVWVIQRDDPADAGPRIVERQTPRATPATPREPPPAVVVQAVAVDAEPSPVVDAGVAVAAAARRAPAEEPPTKPARPAPAPDPSPEAARREPDPPAPETPTPAPPEPARPEPSPPEPAAPEPARPEPSPPEPAAPAEAPPAPAAPAELRCPGGMTLVTQPGFPADGKRRGALVGPGLDAARAGGAYCIDTYEFPGRGQRPRTGVNFEAARGLCIARGHRLCSDAEWRRGCAGRRGGAWPYGAAFDAALCNTEDGDGEERAVAASGDFRRCKSIRGVYDMSGNVAEWTADQTVRGGDFASSDEDASCSAGGKRSPSSARPSIGFRCCADFTE